MSRQARREAIEGYICISPWLVGFIMFVAGPILASLVLSLTYWDIGSPPRWVGLQNYVEIFTDDGNFLQSLKVTLTYAAVTASGEWLATMPVFSRRRGCRCLWRVGR